MPDAARATTNESGERFVPAEVLAPGDLPPLKYRDLPPPIPLRRMIGPSIILAGLALGSGEYVLWPFITYKSGFVFFWACLLGVTIQFFINMEITRWALATGESATTGFIRLSRHLAVVFLFLNVVPWMIPAWAKGSAMLTSWLIWGEQAPYVTELSIAGLVVCGLILSLGPVIYETVEKLQMILVGLIMVLVVGLGILLIRPEAVVAQLEGAVSFGLPDTNTRTGIDVTVLLGALAFAGAGGTLNLGQSNYIKEKGYGMGRYVGRITSPITGKEEPTVETGYHFPNTPENMSRWRQWWRAANWEHFLSFYVTCLVTLVLLTLICYSLYYGDDGSLRPDAPQYEKDDFKFLWGEAKAIGGLPMTLFLLMGVAILVTTEFGVLDAASRISMDIVKVRWLRESKRWSESRLYFLFLWSTILLGSLILVFNDPRLGEYSMDLGSFGLFKLTAAMNGGAMFVYCITLLILNRFRLPKHLRMNALRTAMIVAAIMFYGTFAAWAVWAQFS